jgi:prepilin-type processing-associated H-X9-DG protein
MSEHGPRLSPAAVASLLLGLASLLLLAFAGVPALVLGLRGVRAINASDGRLVGMRLAIAGMALGALTTVVTVLGIGAIVLVHWNDRSERVGCINHLRLIGQGVLAYKMAHRGAYPRAVVPNPDLPPEKRLSWLAAILPYLHEGTPAGKRFEQLGAELDRERAWDSAANALVVRLPLAVFQCPASPSFDTHRPPGRTDYVGLAGIDPDAVTLPLGNPRAGVFGYTRVAHDADFKAGTSFTMLAAETRQAGGPWAAGGPPTVRGLDPDTDDYIGPGRPFGGLHRGGLYVLWADGSVRWVAETVPPADLRAQATLAGKGEEASP